MLDENGPHDLRSFLLHHETFTAAYMGYAGLNNGKLHDMAEAKDALMNYAFKGRFLAEEEGFEPPCELPRKRFSRPPVSTTHPFLHLVFYRDCRRMPA